jgi:hypothetical protein
MPSICLENSTASTDGDDISIDCDNVIFPAPDLIGFWAQDLNEADIALLVSGRLVSGGCRNPKVANGSPQRHPVGQCRTAVARAWHHASGAVSAVRHLRGSDADDKLLILSGMLPTEGHGAKFIGRRRHSRRTALMRPLPSLGKKGKGI